jgi:hypothetical protein
MLAPAGPPPIPTWYLTGLQPCEMLLKTGYGDVRDHRSEQTISGPGERVVRMIRAAGSRIERISSIDVPRPNAPSNTPSASQESRATVLRRRDEEPVTASSAADSELHSATPISPPIRPDPDSPQH